MDLPPRTGSRARPRRAGPAPFLAAAVLFALVAGIAGGLLRAGVRWPGDVPAALGAAAAMHAALMIGGAMGTMVGVERAVAARGGFAWWAPLASAAAVPALLLGAIALGAWLLVLAALLFVAVNVALVRGQKAAHTVLLLAGAIGWLAGNLLFALGLPAAAVLPWWFGFLVVTIAAERLEMTRLMRRRPGAQRSLVGVLALLAAGAALSGFDEALGSVVYGAALLLLAAWFLRHDIARRTVRADGLPRYMAVCLLGGYAWLAVAGLAWAAMPSGLPTRDAALHALGLGFIGSMVMGHAPVILPAVARIKLQFGRAFYLPLAALHLSLLARLGGGAAAAAWRAQGALLNAGALLFFAVTVAVAVLAWRRRDAAVDRPDPMEGAR